MNVKCGGNLAFELFLRSSGEAYEGLPPTTCWLFCSWQPSLSLGVSGDAESLSVTPAQDGQHISSEMHLLPYVHRLSVTSDDFDGIVIGNPVGEYRSTDGTIPCAERRHNMTVVSKPELFQTLLV